MQNLTVKPPEHVRQLIKDAFSRNSDPLKPNRVLWKDFTAEEKKLLKQFIKELHGSGSDCQLIEIWGCRSCGDCEQGDWEDSQWVYYADPDECFDECWNCGDCPDTSDKKPIDGTSKYGNLQEQQMFNPSFFLEDDQKFLNLERQIIWRARHAFDENWGIIGADLSIKKSNIRMAKRPEWALPRNAIVDPIHLTNCSTTVTLNQSIRLNVSAIKGQSFTVKKGVSSSRTGKLSLNFNVLIFKVGAGINWSRKIDLSVSKAQNFKETITKEYKTTVKVKPATEIFMKLSVFESKRKWRFSGSVTVAGVILAFKRGTGAFVHRLPIERLVQNAGDTTFRVSGFVENTSVSEFYLTVSERAIDVNDSNICPPHDEHTSNAISELKDMGIEPFAGSVISVDQIPSDIESSTIQLD